MVSGDGDRPVAVWHPVRGHPGRAVDRPHLGTRVGGDGRGVEGRVLDVVAHRHHVVGAHRFDIHQRAAVVEPELAVVVIGDQEPEVHELRRSADIDLQPLEDGLDGVPFESQRLLHATGVDRARPHPLLDGDVPHDVAAERTDEVGHAGPVDQVAGQQVLRRQSGQLLLGQPGRARSSGHGAAGGVITPTMVGQGWTAVQISVQLQPLSNTAAPARVRSVGRWSTGCRCACRSWS